MTEWWENFFDGEWATIQPEVWTAEQTSQAVDTIERILKLGDPSTVLDVPCGEGRISIELARRGYEVVGVDLSAKMLELAIESSSANDLRVEWHERDMRDLPWDQRFDAAVCWWGSFGYFDDEGNGAFLESVAAALRPGGALLIDSPGLETLLPHWRPRYWSRAGDSIFLEESEYDARTGRVEGTWTIIRGGRESVMRSSVRLYTLRELDALCRRAGFGECVAIDADTGESIEKGFPGRLFLARL